MDEDGSGKISYAEFSGMVRKHLRISTAEMPESLLLAAFANIDTDKSGFISLGEFGGLMRKATKAGSVAQESMVPFYPLVYQGKRETDAARARVLVEQVAYFPHP